MKYMHVLRRRIETEERSTFALAKVLRKEEKKVDNDVVHHVYLPEPEQEPFITTPQARRESIDKGVETWGAAGIIPLVEQDGERYLAVLIKDDKAPSWAGSSVVPSGLYNLVDGRQERFRQSAIREFEEELIFFDDKKEIQPTYKLVSTNDVVIEVYSDYKLIDVFHPFVTAWGTPKDTVTTPMILGTMSLKEGVMVSDGEIVGGKPLCRDVCLMNLTDIRKKPKEVKTRRFIMENYNLKETQETTDLGKHYMSPLVELPVDRFQKMPDNEIDDMF